MDSDDEVMGEGDPPAVVGDTELVAPDDEFDDLVAEPAVVIVAPDDGGRLTVGRLLRACAGVDEALIRQVWPVRHRYVGLGGIVLGTAVAAAVSMTLAISLTAGGLRWYHLGGPLLWGLLVFNLDRWLVSSTHGVGRPWRLIPRLAIAVLFGFVIAEPVVLWIFGDAIEERILDDRADEINTAVTRLKECNPEDDRAAALEKAADPACEGFIVDRAIPAPLALTPDSAEVAQLDDELTQLDERLAQVEASLASARDRYQRELRGDGADTTGLRGAGPVAAAIAAEIDRLVAERDQVEAERTPVLARLTELKNAADDESSGLRTDERSVQATYSQATSEAVAAEVAAVRARNGNSIGLLQRFDALAVLASEHAHILVARWLLTLLLIAVDSMPVIAKAIGGKSAYDRVYSRSLAASERWAQHSEKFAEQEQIKRIELAKFKRGLRRSVLRKKLVVDANRSILELDDELGSMHRSRGLAWERTSWSMGDADAGVASGSPAAGQPARRPYEWGEADPTIDLRSPKVAEANGYNGHRVNVQPPPSARPDEHVVSPPTADPAPTAGSASGSTSTVMTPVEGAADNWLDRYRNQLS